MAFFEEGPVCVDGVFAMWSQQTTRDQPQIFEVQEFFFQMERFIANVYLRSLLTRKKDIKITLNK